MLRSCIAALLQMALAATTVFAAPLTVKATKIAKPPVIDGVIHEDTEWNGVPSVTGLYDEVNGERCPETATVWLAYDSRFIYLAARMTDAQPRRITATQYQVNVNLGRDDNVTFDLDLAASLNDFNTFQVNPRGATSINLAGGRALKREWAGEFQAASHITAAGWETEMRIPWQVMALPKTGPRNVRFDFERYIARLGRTYAIAYINMGDQSDTPIWQAVEIPRQVADREIRLLPYAYAGYDPAVGAIADSGLDLKASPVDQIQLVGSINPDFRNIENQILSLDFSRFARLAGETRPFFLEGSQYIGSALFASQLIPRFDVGVNAYGKASDRINFGVLDATTLGRRNAFVANATYTPNPVSSYRAGITSLNQAGIHNQAYLARYQLNSGPYGIFLREMGTADSLAGRGDNENAAGFYSKKGLFMFGEYTRVTPSFDPRLGFFPEVDYRGLDGSFQYDKPWNRGPLSEAQVGATYLSYQRCFGGDYRRNSDVSGSATLRNRLSLAFDEDADQFEGVDDHVTTLAATYPASSLYDNVGVTYTWGKEANLPYASFTASAARRILDRLQLIGRYQVVNYAGTSDQAIIDLNYDLRHDQAVYGRVAKQGGALNAYLAYRRSGGLGLEYYLIVGDPNALTFRPSIILKVTVPFTLRI